MERLNEDDQVEVSLPLYGPNAPRAPLECHVLAVAGRTLVLEPLDVEASRRLPQATENVLLTFRSSDALVALKGLVLADPTLGDLRFMSPPNEGLRRTRPTRVDIRLPITVRRLDSDVCLDAFTVNLSSGGVLLDSDIEVSVGDAVEVGLARVDEVESALASAIAAVQGVVRRSGQGLVAVEFDPVSARAHKGTIGRLVIEERRASRIRRARRADPRARIEI